MLDTLLKSYKGVLVLRVIAAPRPPFSCPYVAWQEGEGLQSVGVCSHVQMVPICLFLGPPGSHAHLARPFFPIIRHKDRAVQQGRQHSQLHDCPP